MKEYGNQWEELVDAFKSSKIDFFEYVQNFKEGKVQ